MTVGAPTVRCFLSFFRIKQTPRRPSPVATWAPLPLPALRFVAFDRIHDAFELGLRARPQRRPRVHPRNSRERRAWHRCCGEHVRNNRGVRRRRPAVCKREGWPSALDVAAAAMRACLRCSSIYLHRIKGRNLQFGCALTLLSRARVREGFPPSGAFQEGLSRAVCPGLSPPPIDQSGALLRGGPSN